jgi:hypothetical protein
MWFIDYSFNQHGKTGNTHGGYAGFLFCNNSDKNH